MKSTVTALRENNLLRTTPQVVNLRQAMENDPFALFTNPPLAGAASLSVQYWDRECNCRFFLISTKFNGLIFNTEYAT